MLLSETNLNISNELTFPDVYQSENYIGSLAKFLWTPSGLIHFTRNPMRSLDCHKHQKNEIHFFSKI